MNTTPTDTSFAIHGYPRSYIESAVVQIGSETLEVSGEDGGVYWLNGKKGHPFQDGDTFPFASFMVKFRQMSANEKRYRFEFGRHSLSALSLASYKKFVQVDVSSKDEQFVGASGLLGTILILCNFLSCLSLSALTPLCPILVANA